MLPQTFKFVVWSKAWGESWCAKKIREKSEDLFKLSRERKVHFREQQKRSLWPSARCKHTITQTSTVLGYSRGNTGSDSMCGLNYCTRYYSNNCFHMTHWKLDTFVNAFICAEKWVWYFRSTDRCSEGEWDFKKVFTYRASMYIWKSQILNEP